MLDAFYQNLYGPGFVYSVDRAFVSSCQTPCLVLAGNDEAHPRVEEPRESLTYFFRRHADLVRSGLGRADTGPAARRASLVDKVARLSYEDILRTRVAFGTAEMLAERLAAIRDDLGLDGVVAELNPAGMFSVDQMKRTLRALTDQVMPALR